MIDLDFCLKVFICILLGVGSFFFPLVVAYIGVYIMNLGIPKDMEV